MCLLAVPPMNTSPALQPHAVWVKVQAEKAHPYTKKEHKVFFQGGLMNIHCVHMSSLVVIHCKIAISILRGGLGSIAVNKSCYALNQASPEMKRKEK